MGDRRPYWLPIAPYSAVRVQTIGLFCHGMFYIFLLVVENLVRFKQIQRRCALVRLLKKIRVVGSRLSLFYSLPTPIQESVCKNSVSCTQVAHRTQVLIWVQPGTCHSPQDQSSSRLSPLYSSLLSLHFLFPKMRTIISTSGSVPLRTCSEDRM